MPDFSKVQAVMDTIHEEWGIPYCDLACFYKGKEVYRYMTGSVDEAYTRPVTREALVWMYSCTKPITIAAALQLYEQGKLDIDAPVAQYLPEYAEAYYMQDGERVAVGDTMCVRHLMTMSAGLDYDLNSEGVQWARATYGEPTTRQLAAAFIRKPLKFAPGERFEYSLCHDVLAAVIEVVSGETFGDYLRAHIFEPLGMHDTGFFPTAAQKARFSAQHELPPEGHPNRLVDRFSLPFRLSAKHESGGAGLFSGTDDYARFTVAMTGRGVSPEGVRILKPETVELMRTPQVGKVLKNPDMVATFACGPGYSYGLGVRVLVDKQYGQRSHLGEFGWDGAAGSYVLMDPDAEVTMVYTQHVRSWAYTHPERHGLLRDAFYEAMGL